MVNEDNNIGSTVEDRETRQSQWRYVETAYGAEVEAGEFTVRLHWKGAKEPDLIRSVARLIATAPALCHQAIALRDALGQIEWASPEHAEDILDGLIKTHHPQLCAALNGVITVYPD